MCNKALVLMIASLIVIGIAKAEIIYVPNDFETIQAAIDATEDGDTVLVQRGLYYENIIFDGHNIVVGSLFILTGEEDYINSTIIDGDASGSVVVFEDDETQNAALIGFTIRNGSGSLWVDSDRQYYYVGGGIRCIEASPIISHCLVYNNSIEEERSYGGGIYCYDSRALISNCTILRNSCVDNGGGIWCRGDHVTITDCIISENSAEAGGGGGIFSNGHVTVENCYINGNNATGPGGICCEGYALITNCVIENNRAGGIYTRGNSIISECIIIGNSTDHYGGGIFCINNGEPVISNCIIHNNEAGSGGGIACTHSSRTQIKGCLIYENTASRDGGGIYCRDYANITVTNCTVTCNETEIGGGILCGSLSSPIIANSIFSSNSPEEIYFAEDAGDIVISVSYSDISGGEDGIVTNGNGVIDWQRGNIDEDPLFVNADEDDYHLREGSPCIDTGDPHGNLDPDSTRADMGALYYHQDNAVHYTESKLIPDQFVISSIYPNPFNSTTTITYGLDKSASTRLALYSLSGREVKTLFDGYGQAGFHSVNLNAGDLSSGLYFVRLEASGNIQLKKIMLVK